MIRSRQRLVRYAGVFLCLTILCALFPWSGDDWAWGSEIGLELMQSRFEDYNGRYLGNYLVLVLTRSRALRACFMALTYTYFVFLMQKLTEEHRGGAALFGALLFLMPSTMFRQTVSWTSGFTNYVPSLALSFTYICLTKNIFGRERPQYKKGSWVWYLLLGFAGALIIEHITIYHILLCLFVLVYTFLRFKTVYPQHAGFALGTLAGAVCMFSNGAYRLITDQKDLYRSVPQGMSDLVERVYLNYRAVIVPEGFIRCFALSVLLCAAACLAYQVYHGRAKGAAGKLLQLSTAAHAAYTVFVILMNAGQVMDVSLWQKLEMAAAALYMLNWVLFLCCLPVEARVKAQALFILCSAGAQLGLLLFVTPIGPRCLFAPYVFLVYLALFLLGLCAGERGEGPRIVAEAAGISVLVCYLFYVIVFARVAVFEQRRAEKAMQDAAGGAGIIQVENMPYNQFIWYADPVQGTFREESFKKFYGIDDAVIIENVDPVIDYSTWK